VVALGVACYSRASSQWTSDLIADRRDAIKHVLEGIAQRMDDDAQPIAEQLLTKYNDLLS
jgi:hypothetical protein